MKKILLVLLSCLPVICIYGFDWPVTEIKLASSFGQSASGEFSTGIKLIGKNSQVFPITDGEVVFRFNQENDYSSLPRGLGSFVIINHEDNIQSLYGYLESASIDTTSNKVSAGSSFAKIGNTGATMGSTLFLQIFDLEEKILLNPLKQLSPPLKDNEKPIIDKIYIKQNNILSVLTNDQEVNPGEVTILIQAYDVWRDTGYQIRSFTPYKIILNVNGMESASITFDSINEESMQLKLKGNNKTHNEVYKGENFFELGKINLIKGKTHLQAVVMDYSGNQDNKGNISIKDLFITVKEL